MAEFEQVASVSQVPPGSLLTVEVAGNAVLIANVDGKFYAMEATCGHEEWDLSEGRLDGFKVVCAGHGAIWDLRTGAAEFDEPLKARRLYEVKAEGGLLFVKK